MPRNSWRESKLFKALEVLNDRGAITLLSRPEVMDTIEMILDKGGSTPKDYTLHDSDHAFRVAERIWDIIPDVTRRSLTLHELTLLLLSSYLHDIGMSPDFDKVLNHRDFLTSTKKDQLNEDEIDSLQKWIDNENWNFLIDVRKEQITDERRLNQVLSYYIRSRHNDWSGDWITDHLSAIPFDGYSSWVDDLIKLCKSHHFGVEHLSQSAFDPKPVGPSSQIHLRFLAMCLRVADVMENDPERTPEVLLKHRMISSDSLLYWLKDHQFTLRRNGNEFTVHSRPDRALLHKAVEETAQWIENELKLCHELTKIKPLKFSSFGELVSYNWELEPIIRRDIKPKDDLYLYIQGSFRPNAAKILELLGGSQLYGDPISAYRELIQNSFDAIRERIAYQLLNEGLPGQSLDILGDLHPINIKLQKRHDGYWLVCHDHGVGMTKAIIEKFFLESGTSKRYEINELQRRCSEKGIRFERTGQFGIGVLSYFMIADQIVVRTKRALNTGYSDEESKSLQFEMNGAHDFGELKKHLEPINGTEISFKLREELENDIEAWDERFYKFIKGTIKRSPCAISYSSFLGRQLTVKSGWTNDMGDVKEQMVAQFRRLAKENSGELVSLSRREALKTENSQIHEWSTEINDVTEFLFDEGHVEGVGSYRIYFPYFKLKKGVSCYYLKESTKGSRHYVHVLRGGTVWRPSSQGIKYSYKGVAIDVRSAARSWHGPLRMEAFVEIDLQYSKNQTIAVSRHEMTASDDFFQIESIIMGKVRSLLNDNVKKFENVYGSLNRSLVTSVSSQDYWAFPINRTPDAETMQWKKVTYPLFLASESAVVKPTQFRGKKVSILQPIKVFDSRFGDTLTWFKGKKGEFVLALSNITHKLYSGINLFELLQSAPKPFDNSDVNQIQTPNRFNDVLVFVSSRGHVFLNRTHSLYKFYNPVLKTTEVSEEFTTDDLVSEADCFSFLFTRIKHLRGDSWIAFCEVNPSTVEHVFVKLSITYIIGFFNDKFVKIANQKWEVISEKTAARKWAGRADRDFVIEKEDVSKIEP